MLFAVILLLFAVIPGNAQHRDPDPANGICPVKRNCSVYTRCCHGTDCEPCDIEISPTGVFVNGELAELTSYKALKPVRYGNIEYCCKKHHTKKYHCLIYKREPKEES